MNNGLLRGTGKRSSASSTRVPKRLARVVNNVTAQSQTGITTATDLTGMSIAFTVGSYPVRVRMKVGFAYQSTAGQAVRVMLSDASNNLYAGSSAVNTAPSNNGGFGIECECEITTPGAYVVKGRMSNNSGSGTCNTYMDADFVNLIEAIEVAT